MGITIREQLLERAEEDYQLFSSRLLPKQTNILGVRLPVLRKIAKEIAQGDWRAYLKTAENKYFEEIMLQGMVIGSAKADIQEILSYVTNFVPIIDNWSVCDSFCSGLKITNQNKKQVWNYLQQYVASEKEFEVRFGVVMLLDYYIDQEYINQVLTVFDHIKQQGYYAKMAVAWAVSICFIKFPETTFHYLKENALDDDTYNKSIQKIAESLTVDVETKKHIRSMKRK